MSGNYTLPAMIFKSLHESSTSVAVASAIGGVFLALPIVLLSWATFMILRSTIITRHWIMLIAVAVGFAETLGYADRIARPTAYQYISTHWLLTLPPLLLEIIQEDTLLRLQRFIPASESSLSMSQACSRFPLPLEGRSWLKLSSHFVSGFCQVIGVNLIEHSEMSVLGHGMVIFGLLLYTMLLCHLYHSIPTKTPGLETVLDVFSLATVGLLLRAITLFFQYSAGLYRGLTSRKPAPMADDPLTLAGVLLLLGAANYGYFFMNVRQEINKKEAAPVVLDDTV